MTSEISLIANVPVAIERKIGATSETINNASSAWRIEPASSSLPLSASTIKTTATALTLHSPNQLHPTKSSSSPPTIASESVWERTPNQLTAQRNTTNKLGVNG